MVRDGVLQGYFLRLIPARKLGMRSHRQRRRQPQPDCVEPGRASSAACCSDWAAACWSTELLGHGINLVTGGLLRAAPPATGSRTARSRIRWRRSPSPATSRKCSGIAAIGKDVVVRGSKQAGSILIDRMTVAGN